MAAKTRKKAEDKLLLTLACGATVEAAARQCGLSVRTVYRRLADPGTRRALQDLRGDMVQRTMGTLTAMGGEASRGLLELIKPSTAPSVRLGAIRTVLEVGMRLREVVDLEQRIVALEQLQAQTQHK
jgi:hypothetical protein